MSDLPNEAPGLREQVSALAAAVGLELSVERLEGLTAQAEPYFAMIRALDGLPAANEPAAIFRLDQREGAR